MARRAAAIRGRHTAEICAVAVAFLLALEAFTLSPGAAQQAAAERPMRIVSINACTDQLLFALADRNQIAALTHYAAEDDFSIYTGEVKASAIPLIRGSAEEVLKLKPDLVLAGTFTRRATRELLKQYHVNVALFPASDTVDETKAAIRQAAKLFGQPDRGEALIAEIDRALGAAPSLSSRNLSVLQLQRRGFVSGPDTLLGDLLLRLGVRNAAERMGLTGVSRSSVEAALKVRADALVLFDPSARAADQGSALLQHPALAEAYPPERRVVLPGRLIVCGGPALPMAIEALAEGLKPLSPRSAGRQ
jgi:iron complex transport system substrate-binding protein